MRSIGYVRGLSFLERSSHDGEGETFLHGLEPLAQSRLLSARVKAVLKIGLHKHMYTSTRNYSLT